MGIHSGASDWFRRESRLEHMFRGAPFRVCQVLQLNEKLVALPDVFQEQIEHRRCRCQDAAVFDTVTPADVAHLQPRLNAGVVARGYSRESEETRCQGYAVAIMNLAQV